MFDLREMHIIKKALAISVLAIESMPGDLQPWSDMRDMKALLEGLVTSDAEMAMYQATAKIAVTGKVD